MLISLKIFNNLVIVIPNDCPPAREVKIAEWRLIERFSRIGVFFPTLMGSILIQILNLTWIIWEIEMGWLQDETGLEKNAANYVPLTPLSHLRRASTVFSNRTAVVYGTHRKTYAEYSVSYTHLTLPTKRIV